MQATGTWTHDKVGGHMFGTIVGIDPEGAAAAAGKRLGAPVESGATSPTETDAVR